MTRFLSSRTGQIAAAVAAAVVVIGVVLAIVLTAGSSHSSSSRTATKKAGLTIVVSNLKGAPANRIVVRAVLADAKSHLVQQGVLLVRRRLTINPVPETARILAVSVGDCARLPVATTSVKGRKRHGKRPVQRFRVDCSTFTRASSLAPIHLTGGPQTVSIGLYCVRPGGAIDCSASRVSVSP